jgi:N-acetylglucosamine-6-sulfatase
LAGAALVLSLVLIAATLGAGRGAAQEAPPPNFVVIFSDDQAPGMTKALPTVQRELGARGTTFSSAIASYPLCCPARATFLTGQYAHNHGTKGNNRRGGGGYQALIDPKRNLAAWLQANGYDTAFAGKWLNGLRTPHRTPPGWTSWSGLVGDGGDGLSSYYDFDVFEPDGTPRHFGTRPSDYQTDALTREYALPFIDAYAAATQPFFLWLAYHPPHFGLGRADPAGERCSNGAPTKRSGSQSAIPPPRYAKRFLAARLPRPPSFDERDISDKPKSIRRRAPLTGEEIERVERDYRCGLAALLALDDAVGEIVERLRATGQLERTVIVFTADQGVMAGEHRIARGKNKPYEEALRVPLLVRGPDVAAGRTVEAPVANADLAPTILDLAGATVPEDLARPMDGLSLRAALTGEAPDARRAVPIEGRENTASARHGFKVRSYVGVRTARFAYVEYRRARFDTVGAANSGPLGAGRTTDRELYDLRRDPYELRNLAREPSLAGVRRELARLTAEGARCSGTGCALDFPPGAQEVRPGAR